MSKYRVEFGPAAGKAFKGLPPEIRSRTQPALEKLARDAARPGNIGGRSVKTIHGLSDSFHRLLVGDYRVMYDAIDGDRVILVLGVVHRGDLERWLRGR